MRLSALTARKQGWPLANHVAESELEFEMFATRRGEMFDWLQRNERDMTDCGLGSPVQHLDRCGALGANLLAVHVNYLATRGRRLLGRESVSVVHCPRSHLIFATTNFRSPTEPKAKVNSASAPTAWPPFQETPRQTVN